MPSITNFDRFASMLSRYQREALASIKEALQDDPTCLDTHHAGFVSVEQEEKKEDSQ